MREFTEKYNNTYKFEATQNAIAKMADKMGKIEDIEEELGIDLLTLFKALNGSIYVKNKNGISKHSCIHLHKWYQTELVLYYRPYSHIRIKDYGTTWALTPEELKNDSRD